MNFKLYAMPQVPTNTPFRLPKVPTHNPDPNYRETLLKVLNDTYEEAQEIQKCLAAPRASLVLKLQKLYALNKEAKALLIQDGYTEFKGGRSTTRRKARKVRKMRKRNTRKH